ncbi:hypothetical protein F4X90_22500 [Candidatus Poribacteria bacterium]|nr:hypothetical protein [Candidatus Poribacteria bacterium]
MTSNTFEENYLSLLADFYHKVPVSEMAEMYDVSRQHIYRWKDQLEAVLSAITPEIAAAFLRSDVETLSYDIEQLEDGGYMLRWRTQVKRMNPDLPRIIRMAEGYEKKRRAVSLSKGVLPDYLVPIDFQDGIHRVAAMYDEIPKDMRTIDKENSFISLDATFDVPAVTSKDDDGILRNLFKRLLVQKSVEIAGGEGLTYLVPTLFIEREIPLTEATYQAFSRKPEALEFKALQAFAKSKECRILSQRKTLQEKSVSENDIQRLKAYLDKADETEDEDLEPKDGVINVSHQIAIVLFTDRETWFYDEKGMAEKSLKQQKSRNKDYLQSENLQRVCLRYEAFYLVPRGNIKDSWGCFEREQLLRGGRNTGKTISNILRLHIAACKYPKSRIAVCRRTLGAVYPSFGKTFEAKIAGLDSASGLMRNNFVRRTGTGEDDGYQYWNATEIIFVGLQNRGDVLSMEYDMGVILQAEQIELSDWVYILTSIGRGAGHNMPYHLLLADCNPPEIEGDFHWLFQREKIKVFDTAHTDNPELYDDRGQKTELGITYVDTLESLPDAEKTRFHQGRSANGNMKVFPGFSQRHIITLDEFYARIETLTVKRCLLGFDAGFRPSPGVLLLCVETDGGFYALRGTSRVAWKDHKWVDRALDYQDFIQEKFQQRIYALYSEHDPRLIDAFREEGLPVTKAEKREKALSIRQLEDLMGQEDQFFVVREHVDDPDPLLARQNVPQDLIAELIAYRWTDAHLRTGGDPSPRDGDDHWIDALLYIIRTAKIGAIQRSPIFDSLVITREQAMAQREQGGRIEDETAVLPHTPRHRYQDAINDHASPFVGYAERLDIVLSRAERGPRRYLRYIQAGQDQDGSSDEDDYDQN